jgi:hypothetical protein
MLKQFVRGLLVCGLAATMQSVTADQPLKGTYRGTLNTHCMESMDGFTPNLLFDLHGGWGGKYTDTSLSTAVFADGKMTETLRGTTYFQGDPLNPGSLGAGTFESTCNYTVTANPNNSIVLTEGKCSGFIPLGPAAGQNVTVEGIIAKGQVSEDKSIIIIGSEEPNAQILKLFIPGQSEPRYIANRLCGSSSTYIRLK